MAFAEQAAGMGGAAAILTRCWVVLRNRLSGAPVCDTWFDMVVMAIRYFQQMVLVSCGCKASDTYVVCVVISLN